MNRTSKLYNVNGRDRFDGISSFIRPLYVGPCAGDRDYWVTTYLFVDPYPVQDSELQAENGLLLDWKTEAELSDDAVSPFASYNRRVFAALKQVTRNEQDITTTI